MQSPKSEPIFRIDRPEYEALGVRGNPFAIAGISSVNAPYPLIDPKMDEEVRNFLNQTLQSEEYGGLAILGEFGAGKTYALRYIETLLETIQTRPDAEELLAVYVERPKPTVMALVADICERIGRIRIKNILLEMILVDLANTLESADPAAKKRRDRLTKSLRDAGHPDLFSKDADLSSLTAPDAILNPASTLDRMRARGFKTEALLSFGAESLTAVFGARDKVAIDVVDHLAEFALADSSRSVSRWSSFLAGRICSRQQTVRQLSGQQIWSLLVKILRRAGYKMIYVLIDEFEETDYQQLRPAALRSFLADLRDLIDATLEGFALIIASKVNAWELCKSLNAAFSQRFARVVVLPPNSYQDLKRMIEERLKVVRVADAGGKAISPFTEGAIRALERESKGNTRVAVQACHLLMWHAAVTAAPQITAEMVADLNEISRAFYYARSGDVGSL